MTENKQSQKELKRPDSLQLGFYSFLDKVLKQRMVILGFLGILMGIYAIILAASYFRDHKAEGRRAELAVIDEQFNKETEALEPKQAELRKKIEALSPKPAADGKMPELDPAVKAQMEALRAEGEGLKADHSGSAESYKKYFEAHDSDAEGWYAGNRFGESLVEKRQMAEAKTWYENLLKKSVTSPFYQSKLKLTVAALDEDQKDYDGALKLLEELNGSADKELKPVLLLAKARIQAQQSKVEESKATIDSLLKDYSESQEAEKARGMKALL